MVTPPEHAPFSEGFKDWLKQRLLWVKVEGAKMEIEYDKLAQRLDILRDQIEEDRALMLNLEAVVALVEKEPHA